jgi:pyrimidine-specific ribonucleoside hydrolase
MPAHAPSPFDRAWPDPERRRPVILDGDPGHDDALAILLALASPRLDVLAITTVSGNASVDRTTGNALRVLTLLGRVDIPVAAGAERPLRREPWVPVSVHGESGLDGAELPEAAATARPESAVELMAALLRASPVPVTLVPTGPLTNIALLLRAVPMLRDRIAAISLMGGGIGIGNTTAVAEFNVWQDPEAAAIVFESGIPLAMAGLDVTHQALMLPPDVARLEETGTRTGRTFADLLRYFGNHHKRRYGWDGPPVHDALAVLRLTHPQLFSTEFLRVDVATGDGLARGATIADPEGLTGRSPNVDVSRTIDRERFVDVVVDAAARFP